MKRYVSIIALLLCALILNVKAINKNDNPKKITGVECSCCKNCKDENCKALCSEWDKMTPEARMGEEGKKVKEACMQICKEKKCCSTDGTCMAMSDSNSKSCCKKK